MDCASGRTAVTAAVVSAHAPSGLGGRLRAALSGACRASVPPSLRDALSAVSDKPSAPVDGTWTGVCVCVGATRMRPRGGPLRQAGVCRTLWDT